MNRLADIRRWWSAPLLLSLLAYAALTVVLFTVFLYLVFPWGALSEWIRARAEAILDARVEVQSSRVQFPLRLVWTGVTISLRQNPAARIVLDQVAVDWPVGALLRRQANLSVVWRAAGGEGAAAVALQNTGRGVQYHAKGSVTGVDIVTVAGYLGRPLTGVSGKLSVTVPNHDWIGADALRGNGSFEISATDIQINSVPLTLQSITGRVLLKGGVGTIEELHAVGPEIDLVGSGTLLLRAPVADSLLNLASRVVVKKPTGMLAFLVTPGKDAMDLAVRGTLARPGVYLNGSLIPLGPIGQGA